MIGGSVQQRAYRRYRADDFDTKQAASFAGISIGEAQLIDAEDAKNPPPAEALEPIPAPVGHNSKEADTPPPSKTRARSPPRNSACSSSASSAWRRRRRALATTSRTSWRR